MPVGLTADVRIAVVGLGYVGLPLALALARHYAVTGFDADGDRMAELKRGHDHTGESDPSALGASSLAISDDATAIAGANVFIVAVPTPVHADKRPDLGSLVSACRAIGAGLERDGVVVFESTVYPGVTERICGPELEAASGLACGRDFFLGYAPERINPGDRAHGIARIAKVVAGQTPAVTALLRDLYGSISSAGIFVAKDIMTAEAAKVIENAQRDINIAFINEVTQILGKLELSVYQVLEAAATKWNFLDFRPGLVGGHCIGVDPYYLAHAARSVGHEPEIILAGRRINDGMGAYVADRLADALSRLSPDGQPARVLVLGLTFKEDVPDLRNSKVVDVVEGLRAHGHRVQVHDPKADPAEAKALYGTELLADIDEARDYDCVVAAVAHGGYRAFTSERLARLVRPGGLIADVKGIWRAVPLPDTVKRWQL